MTLIELKRRVDEATGPDRELDSAIKLAVAAHMFVAGSKKDEVVAVVDGDLYDDPLPYTSSLDAVVALIERVLPGWVGCVFFGGESPHSADLIGPLKEIGKDFEGKSVEIYDSATGEGPTPALALLSAFLSAMIAREK